MAEDLAIKGPMNGEDREMLMECHGFMFQEVVLIGETNNSLEGEDIIERMVIINKIT